MEKVKVMIVDDQYIARQLFEMYIKSSEKYKLVLQVDSAALVKHIHYKFYLLI